MIQNETIKKTANFVREKLKKDTSGHDWWHTYRVWKMAKYIAEKEGANMFIVEIAALLHDIADWKFHKGDESAGPKLAREWLKKLNVDKDIIDKITDIIAIVPYKGALHKAEIKTIEGMVVQDADRLDAMGAIGIARCFAFGAHLGNPIHDPNIKPKVDKTVEEYKKMKETSINHFYEKLLLLKDRMNTKTAKQIAEGRHKFMEEFLDRFFKEWDGKL